VKHCLCSSFGSAPIVAAFVILAASAAHADDGCEDGTLTPMQDLGRQLFEDANLSVSGTQSCASCHGSERAFTGNNSGDPLFPVAIGALPSLIGVRNTPTAMYAAFIPTFSFVDDGGEWVPRGGQFLDGRADTLAAQARGPFLNPREMAMPSEAAVVGQLAQAAYAPLFRDVFGAEIFADVDAAYTAMTRAIEAFEQTPGFLPFSSKFDAVLRGEAELSPDEARGFELFKDPDKGNCIACHTGDPDSRNPESWLFTDFTYDNLGVPRNPRIPDNADPEFFDLGLCEQPGLRAKLPAGIEAADDFVGALCGAFKVPTLRNVGLTAPYMHNGYFESLRDVVEFYSTRDTNPERWYPSVGGELVRFNDLPSIFRANVNTSEVPYDRGVGGDPHLSSTEIDQVVAFLMTLSDGYSQ
jgi:cytochrome c peroxidase